MTYNVKQIRNVHIVRQNNTAEQLQRITAINEQWLQELIADCPELLPVQQLDATTSNIVCIGREVQVGTADNQGYIDNLYVTSSGQIIIVETKLYRNQEARREVVSQIIEYAKELQQWNCERLDNVCESYTAHREGQAFRMIDLMCKYGYLSFSDEGAFNDNVNRCLSDASFILMIVGDGIRTNVEDIAGFLNNNSAMHFNLALAEIELYKNGDEVIAVPNILTKTSVINRSVITLSDKDKLSVIDNTPVQKKTLSRREFVSRFSSIGGYNSDDITDFILNLEEINGLFVNITATELQICYFPSGVDSFTLLHFSIWNNHADLYLMPGPINRNLEKNGIFPFEADGFYDFYRPYIDATRCKSKPYEKTDNCYYSDINAVLRDSDAFVRAVQQFVNSISE